MKQILLLISLIILSVSCTLSQETIYIEANEFGRGIVKPRAAECFAIVPLHIVEESNDIEIIGEKNVKTKGSLIQATANDLAIVRTTNGGELYCEDWKVDGNYDRILENAADGVLKIRQNDGGFKWMQVDIIEVNETNITIEPRKQNNSFSKGMSGSALFTDVAGDKICLGMLMNIDSEIKEGYVLQLDDILANLQDFFDVEANKSNTNKTEDNNDLKPTINKALEKGLIAYYPFNGNAQDESKNNNNGVVYEATLTQDRFGNENAAYDFDGKDDFIEVLVESEDFKSIGDFTLSVWVYFRGFKKKHSSSSVFDRQYIFNGHGHSKTVRSGFYKEGFNLVLDWKKNNNEFLFGAMTRSGTKEFATSVPIKNAWNHIVFIAKNETAYLYINNQLKSKEAANSNNMDMFHNLFIGTFTGNNPYQTKGKYNYSFSVK